VESPIPLQHGPIGELHWDGQPPFDIQHHPRHLGVSLNRLDHESVIDAVEELLDVQIDHPVTLPAPIPAYPHRVQSRPPPVGSRRSPGWKIGSTFASSLFATTV
jgi:hypothetical protein